MTNHCLSSRCKTNKPLVLALHQKHQRHSEQLRRFRLVFDSMSPKDLPHRALHRPRSLLALWLRQTRVERLPALLSPLLAG